MKNKKILIAMMSLVIVVIVAIIIMSNSLASVVKYYLADIEVDEYGHITVEETIVVDYKSYENYLLRDIKYGKTDYRQDPYSNYQASVYANDKATFDESSVSVSVYRGNLVDEPSDCIDITNQIAIGYSYKDDWYVTESGSYPVECPPGSGACECIAVDAIYSGTLIGEMTFRYRYTINGMVTSFNDCAELNYKLFEYMGKTVKNATVSVYLPSTDLSSDDFYGYGHGLGNGEVIQRGNNRFDFVAKNIKKTEEFEIRVVFPKEVVSRINSKNIVNANLLRDITSYEEELARETYNQYIVAIIGNIITAIVILAMIYIIYKVYLKYDKEFKPEFEQQYLRELPYEYTPAIMSYLYYFAQTNDEDVTATLLDLIRRGYLELVAEGDINAKDPDFIIRLKTDKMPEELFPHEKHLIYWFIKRIGNGTEVSIQQIEKYGSRYEQAQNFQTDALNFKLKVKESAVKYDFFINTAVHKSVAFSYVLLPIILIIGLLSVGSVFNVTFQINIIILIIFSLGYIGYVASIKKRSLNGAEEYAKWKAFKRFLEDFGSFKDYPMPGIIVWEQYLAYATSLKIADKVMEQLKVRLPEIPQNQGTYMSSRYYGRAYMHMYMFNTIHRVNRSITSARSNTVNSINAHNATKFRNGGGGHGGGFSGGSSFGGGGGGFRGGR